MCVCVTIENHLFTHRIITHFGLNYRNSPYGVTEVMGDQSPWVFHKSWSSIFPGWFWGTQCLGNFHTEVSWNRGTSKSSLWLGFSLANHPFGVPPFQETSIYNWWYVRKYNWHKNSGHLLRIRGTSKSKWHVTWADRVLSGLRTIPATKTWVMKTRFDHGTHGSKGKGFTDRALIWKKLTALAPPRRNAGLTGFQKS